MCLIDHPPVAAVDINWGKSPTTDSQGYTSVSSSWNLWSRASVFSSCSGCESDEFRGMNHLSPGARIVMAYWKQITWRLCPCRQGLVEIIPPHFWRLPVRGSNRFWGHHDGSLWVWSQLTWKKRWQPSDAARRTGSLKSASARGDQHADRCEELLLNNYSI